jgi:porin
VSVLGGRAAWFAVLIGAALVAYDGTGAAQSPPAPADKPAPITTVAAVSGNPAATTYSTGTGWLGRTLGIPDEWGIKLGGLWLADTNLVAAGGAQPGGWTSNSALFGSLAIDAEKLVQWRGASFGVAILQLNGANTNGEAGSVTGYNGIVGHTPFERTELYEAWYLQQIVKDVLQVRMGRVAPANDFNNVLRPVTFTGEDAGKNIPAVSGLLYSTIFANGTLIGALPGYYNTAVGITVNFTPTKNFYLNIGSYDGNGARNTVQTGLSPPLFNGYYFNIAEIGTNWVLGADRKPGQFGIGLWRQTGLLTVTGPSNVTQDGTGGVYMFGSQQIAFRVNDRVPNSSISAFFQFGASNSETLPVNQYYGAGLTGFGLIGDRDLDSMGLGVSFSRLNQNIFARASEVILQAYYQAHLYGATFLQPTISYIPAPGTSPTLPGALMLTMRLTVLF